MPHFPHQTRLAAVGMLGATRIGRADRAPPLAFIQRRHLRLAQFIGQRNHGSAGVPQGFTLIPALPPHQTVEALGAPREWLHRVAGQGGGKQLVRREHARRQTHRMAAPRGSDAKRAPQRRHRVQAGQQQGGGTQIRPVDLITKHTRDAHRQIRRGFK